MRLETFVVCALLLALGGSGAMGERLDSDSLVLDRSAPTLIHTVTLFTSLGSRVVPMTPNTAKHVYTAGR